MKVFENIDAFEQERPTFSGLSEKEIADLSRELRRIIKDLMPLRKSRKATEEYYHNYLCQSEIIERYEEKMDMLRLCQPGRPEQPYKPSGKETHFPEDTLHSALIQVLKDDRYSFGHLYWLMCSRINRQMGIAFYDDIVVSDKVIEYATDFDVEELHAKYKSIGDAIDSLDYLDMRLIDSKKFDPDSDDKVLAKLKERFEGVANYIKELGEKRLTSLDKNVRRPCGQVREIPLYQDSIGYIESGKTEYLTYYDFTKCPIDVSLYPFSVHLGTYSITRTERGLEDASPILNDILQNTYKQVGFAGGSEAEDIFKDTRELLQWLHRTFIEEAHSLYGDDFDRMLTLSKWWTMNTARCISAAFNTDVLPESNSPVPEAGIPDYRSDAWLKCNFFRKTMSEYCLYLTVNAVIQFSYNPYRTVHSVIPFNFYGDKYDEVVSCASSKRIKTEKDRIATSFIHNCGHFRSYLEERLSTLDGKDINAPDAVSERHLIASDIIEMANSYITHVEEAGVSDPAAQKYAFEFWNWFVRCTMEDIIDTDFSKKIFQPLPPEVKSEEDLVVIHNTSEQYKSFCLYYNRQSVQVQKEFLGDCLTKMASKTEADEGADSSDLTEVHEVGIGCTPGPRKGSSHKPFRDYILSADEADNLLTVLHSLIDGKSGASAYKIIYAATKGSYLDKPSYNAVNNEFTISGSESGYNRFFKQTLFPKDTDPINNKIKEELEKLK